MYMNLDSMYACTHIPLWNGKYAINKPNVSLNKPTIWLNKQEFTCGRGNNPQGYEVQFQINVHELKEILFLSHLH